MDKLAQHLNLISGGLKPLKIAVDGFSDESHIYDFDGFELDTQREPPVASGYVLQIVIRIAASRLEEKKDTFGRIVECRGRYSFPPERIRFIYRPPDIELGFKSGANHMKPTKKQKPMKKPGKGGRGC